MKLVLTQANSSSPLKKSFRARNRASGGQYTRRNLEYPPIRLRFAGCTDLGISAPRIESTFSTDC